MTIYYLRHCPYSLARISELLGFKEPSSFHKACMRWFGMPPGHYRAQLLGMPALECDSVRGLRQ
ncbi:helix-turn-helix domain-containing protein [Pseudomonas aeruginosa]